MPVALAARHGELGMPADRRAGKVPHVGKQPRARTKAGAWRTKRSDAGKKKPKKKGFLGGLFG
jgi:hypothetical protein